MITFIVSTFAAPHGRDNHVGSAGDTRNDEKYKK